MRTASTCFQTCCLLTSINIPTFSYYKRLFVFTALACCVSVADLFLLPQLSPLKPSRKSCVNPMSGAPKVAAGGADLVALQSELCSASLTVPKAAHCPQSICRADHPDTNSLVLCVPPSCHSDRRVGNKTNMASKINEPVYSEP